MINSLRLSTIIMLAMSCSFADAGLVKNQIFTIDGLDRTFDIFIPDQDFNKARPLALLLHGHMGNADVMTGENNRKAPYMVWLSIAKREGWFLLIPDGEHGSDNYRGWNDCRKDATTNPATDDVKFLNSLVDAVTSQYRIDKNRTYVHGTSNGGHMAYRLAQESGDRYRGIAAVVASMPEKNKCKEAKHPVSVLVMNGTEDPILPYLGGKVGKRKTDKYERGSILSTTDTIKYWLRNNEITSPPVELTLPDKSKRDRSRVQVKRYTGGKNNTEVVLFKVIGGGHTEPSLTQRYRRLYKYVTGKQNRDIEMAEEVWKFFDRQR